MEFQGGGTSWMPDNVTFGRVYQVAAPGAKSAISSLSCFDDAYQ